MSRFSTYARIAYTLVTLLASQSSATLNEEGFLEKCIFLGSEQECLESLNELNPFYLEQTKVNLIKKIARTHTSDKVRATAKSILNGEDTPSTRITSEFAYHLAMNRHYRSASTWHHHLERLEKLNPTKLTNEDRQYLKNVAWLDADWRVRMAANIVLLGGATDWAKENFREKNLPWHQKLKAAAKSCARFLLLD